MTTKYSIKFINHNSHNDIWWEQFYTVEQIIDRLQLIERGKRAAMTIIVRMFDNKHKHGLTVATKAYGELSLREVGYRLDYSTARELDQGLTNWSR